MSGLNRKISRRKFVGGSVAVGTGALFAGLFGGPVLANPAISNAAGIGSTVGGSQAYPFFVYHCKLVHKAMGDKLSRIVADPAISETDTNLALRTTRCPCCDTQISPSFSDHIEKGAGHV